LGFYEDIRSSGRPVVIFGASVLGEVALRALTVCGFFPLCFGDNDKMKQGKLFHGYQVAGLDEIHAKYPDAIIVIGADRYYAEIYEQISSKGYRNVYSDADVISTIDFSAVPYEKIKGIAWRLAQMGQLSWTKSIATDGLRLERLNIVVTERCTLSCRNCSSMMPFYGKPRDCDTLLLLKSIERILKCVDFIYHMEVLGGETFLNKELPLIINELTHYDNILQIDIITNGTIMPSHDLLDRLRYDNICVVVNDYGPLSKKKAELLAALNNAGVKNRQNRHWAWADLGGFEPRNRNIASSGRLFQKCNFKTCAELLHGELHRCPRSSHGMNTKMIPRYIDDYINICGVNDNTADLKERIGCLFKDKKFLHACDYCDGNTRDSLLLEPAIQTYQNRVNNGKAKTLVRY
jgi:hypothetical protein